MTVLRPTPSLRLRPVRACSRTALLAILGSAAYLCTSPDSFAHGAIDERVAELTDDLTRSPDDAFLHYQLADANCQHEDWLAAMRSLARVEEIAPGKYPVDLMRGRINLGAKRPEQAIEALERFLKVEPGNPMALIYRARALALVGRAEEGLADYRTALARAVNPEPDHFQEAAEAMVSCGRTEEAVHVICAAIEKLGPVPSLVLKAMELEVATGQFDGALTRVDQMQSSAPRPEPWMAKRAELLGMAGRPEEARTAWQSLAARIAALPNLERGSHSMSTLAEQAQQALRRLSSATPTTPTPLP